MRAPGNILPGQSLLAAGCRVWKRLWGAVELFFTVINHNDNPACFVKQIPPCYGRNTLQKPFNWLVACRIRNRSHLPSHSGASLGAGQAPMELLRKSDAGVAFPAWSRSGTSGDRTGA